MDFMHVGSMVGEQMTHQIINDIYQDIIREHIIYSIKVGLLAGFIMAIVATILGLTGFTKLNLTTYTGCMITTKSKGVAPMIAGSIFHLIMSAVFGVLYLYLIHTFNIPTTLLYGILLGLAHTLFSGTFMLVLDAINPCVANKSIDRVGFVASAQGLNSVISYTLIHVIYAVIVVVMLGR